MSACRRSRPEGPMGTAPATSLAQLAHSMPPARGEKNATSSSPQSVQRRSSGLQPPCAVTLNVYAAATRSRRSWSGACSHAVSAREHIANRYGSGMSSKHVRRATSHTHDAALTRAMSPRSPACGFTVAASVMMPRLRPLAMRKSVSLKSSTRAARRPPGFRPPFAITSARWPSCVSSVRIRSCSFRRVLLSITIALVRTLLLPATGRYSS